ncbi:hypothetical protein NP493_440g01008 [Ridgeia piscesae]|uniref:Raptor N-terminal CASPase-like domain-containing protein n=1 Tax=Ridgeia piscesae TaxID=27915 RepID=A0AAD9L0V0_RIDPI|nr:hypothetical protein NP493_440g01008 [Ridgeia piscesae]
MPNACVRKPDVRSLAKFDNIMAVEQLEDRCDKANGDRIVEQPPPLDGRSLWAFTLKRHLEKIEGSKTVTQTWRMKERMKTVSVALVLCLNVGVDPPDVVKISPCARLECWIDPLSMSPQKALEAIGSSLQRQYERWQPRARYKQSLDPTMEEVKKLCISLRRNAKEERVLFHYNGHGVPRPTVNGEIWVFNKSYTQYIPLSVYDLQTWMGSPSIYVYDCSNAGIIIQSFKQFSVQREQEMALTMSSNKSDMSASGSSTKNCIQLAACSTNELLPMNPELPADLFTACLTTPIKTALRWFVLQNTGKLVPNVTLDLIDKIPGQLNDRRTMLGELNWIFTAITDTIAWNTLPRELFQKLFRQDLLVASLFRNFLLAERIMRSYNCTPVSSPKFPHTYQHPMWQAWDLALDLCLSQLPQMADGRSFQHSPFFAEQLTAFQVWLNYGSEKRSPPEQLPIVLQVLLSQVHRLRALDLLGHFLDLGAWAVSLALSVGIFPYVLKLLQSSARELRPLLVFIWAKILAVDNSCQADLVKDSCHRYFISVLTDSYMPPDHRTMAAFVLAMIVNNYRTGQEAALQANLIAICLEQLKDEHHLLRQWLALCLGKVWTSFDAARWCGVRDSAHEKLYKLLKDPIPEVRAAAVFALGTFISNTTERSDHANNIDHSVAMTLLSVTQDGSSLVRKELVVALGGLVMHSEVQFAAVAFKFLEEEKQQKTLPVPPVGLNIAIAPDATGMSTVGAVTSGMRRSASARSLKAPLIPSNQTGGATLTVNTNGNGELMSIKRVPSNTSISGLLGTSYGGVYTHVWKALMQLVLDPCPKVADMTKTITDFVKQKVNVGSTQPKQVTKRKSASSQSAPSSPSNKPPLSLMCTTPPKSNMVDPHTHPSVRATDQVMSPRNLPIGGATSNYPHSSQFSRTRKLFDRGPDLLEESSEETQQKRQLVSTEYFQWSCRHFSQSLMAASDDTDPESTTRHEHNYRLSRAQHVRQEAQVEQSRAGFSRLDEQIFINRNESLPGVVRFHPYEPHLAVADKEGVSLWDWQQGVKMTHFHNYNPHSSRITCMDFINCDSDALLLIGSDDGAVRVWGRFGRDTPPELVTSWQALSDMLPSNRASGLVIDWEQKTGRLFASGDVRTIQVWDAHRELKIQDVATGVDSCVTSLTAGHLDQNVVIAGFGDGCVRLYDYRVNNSECRITSLRKHLGWVVKVHMLNESTVLSASVDGEIRRWDMRMDKMLNNISVKQGVMSVEVHSYADIIACASGQQFIGVFNQSGDTLSQIKYHIGFMGQRIAPVTCLAFHPYKVRLAAGCSDNIVSVYSVPEQRRR